MATGYDRRQSSRETFAFNPVAPVQRQSSASGRSRGAEVVGGQSRGEAIAAGPQTDAGPVAAGLGQLVGDLMRPHVQRRQQEEFFLGFTRMQEGVALDEISKSSSGLNKVFGPTAYEQGAQFFTAKARLDKWQQERLAELDTLKRMTPEEASKVLGKTSQDLMTGDPFADQLIQSGLIEAAGPLMNTVSKARYAFQQEQAINAWSDAGKQGAGALQALAVAQSKLSDPSDTDKAALTQQVGGFLGGMVQPHGMDDETYRKGLFNFMRNSMQDGNFYAVEAMRSAGVDRVFDDQERTRLDDAYTRYANKRLADASINFAPELLELDAEIKTAEVQPEGKGITGMQAAARLADINNKIKRSVGVQGVDLFGLDDIRGAAGNVTGAIVSAYKRAEERRWQIEDRDQRRAWEVEDREAEEAESAAQVGAMWAIGAVNTGLAQGMKAGDFDLLAIQDYRSGEVKRIALAYEREGWVSGRVGQMMRSRVQASIGTQYTNDFKTGHDEWQRLYSVNPSAAKAYYGNLHLPMQRFDALVKGGTTPQIAFARSFGDPAAYSQERVPAERRRGVREAAVAAVDANEPYTLFGWGLTGTPLNDSSKRAMVSAVAANAGVSVASAPGLSDSDAVRQEMEGLYRSGRAERYGQWFWSNNRSGTQPLSRMLGLQDSEAGNVIDGVISAKLKASGFTGDDGNVIRINGPDNHPMLVVQGTSEDGDRTVTIPFTELKAATAARVGKQVRGNQPSPDGARARTAVQQGLDPRRRIPGEKGWQRVKRINLENAARGIPDYNP